MSSQATVAPREPAAKLVPGEPRPLSDPGLTAPAAGEIETPPSGRHVLRSALAGYAIQAARLVIGLIPRLILAHLLLPEVHGLYAWALRIVTVASALRDLGLPYHLIRDLRRPYGTVFGFTLVSGALWSLVVAAAAPLAGALDPALPAVVRVFAVWILLDGLVVVRERVVVQLAGGPRDE